MHLPLHRVYVHVDPARERGALLEKVLPEESEPASLREDGRVVVQGAVLEVKHQLARDLPAARDLNQITVGQQRTVQGVQGQEAVKAALQLPNGYWFPLQTTRRQHDHQGQECGSRHTAEQKGDPSPAFASSPGASASRLPRRSTRDHSGEVRRHADIDYVEREGFPETRLTGSA